MVVAALTPWGLTRPVPLSLWPAWSWSRDTLEVRVPVVRIRCAGCGRTMSVSFARCPGCSRVWGWALLEYVGLHPIQVPVAAPDRRAQVDDATAAHIAEQVRDAYAFGEVTIERRDVGVDHRDVIRSATLRSFRQGR